MSGRSAGPDLLPDHRLAVPRLAAPAAVLRLGAPGVVPLRGHLWTDGGGGPAIAALTGVPVLALRDPATVSGPPTLLVRLGSVSGAASLGNHPLSRWLPAVPALALTLVAAALSWRCVEAPRRSRPAPAVAA